MARKDVVVKEARPRVFISFNNGSKEFVDCLEEKLSKKATVLRYEHAVSDWDSLTGFMNSIKNQDFAVFFVSNPYLRSYACMYEVIQAMQQTDWKDRSMFVVLPDARGVYSLETRIEYIKYWIKECEDKESALQSLSEAETKSLQARIENMKKIRDSMDEFLEAVCDKKNPPICKAIEAICEKVEASKATRFYVNAPEGPVYYKHWLIIEALKEHGSMTIQELSSELGLNQRTASRWIKKLMQSGVIAVEGDPCDRRYSLGGEVG